MSDVSDRKDLEAQFHDAREYDKKTLDEEAFLKKYSNKRFYAIAKKVREYEDTVLRARAPGGEVLDYCCGPGETSLKLAEMGYASVTGIDISPIEVASAEKRLEGAGFGEKSTFHVMDAENLDFAADTFDVIVCNGVLHHLDIDAALPELARVLKPDGVIVAMEALGYNPLINLYRKMTPHLRTAWETDHILTLTELNKAKKYFRQVDVRYFYLATLAAIPFSGTPLFRPVMVIVEALDALLMRLPLIKLMAWQMVFTLKNPKV